jgi:uncharacterized protein
MIAGRLKEIEQLNEALSSQQAEMIVLYGRRRIGKTFLIEQLYGKQADYFFHTTGIKDGPMKEQLAEFSRQIGDAFYNGASISPQKTWLDTFRELSTAIDNSHPDKKVILFLDELPWLCTKRSRLLQAIDYYWNRYWKNNPRIKLVLCGSSASWIIRKVINDKGGLHNRLTYQLLLQPFTLAETKEFLKQKNINLSNQQIVQIYMAIGGVPYYLTQVKKGKSATQVIDQLCFQKNALLYDEFNKLFSSLFEDADYYKELIRVIAKKRSGLSLTEIEQNCPGLSSGGTLTTKLKDLEDAAFIKSFMPLGHKRQGKYFKVIDEYCYFYLQWIEPIKNELSLDYSENQQWMNIAGTAKYYSWQGYAFELVCYKHLNLIRKSLDIHQGVTISSWRYLPKKLEVKKGAQIDLLFDRKDGVVTLCEIKYTEKPFAIDKTYSENIKQKIMTYREQTRTKKHINVAFISANGLKDNNYSQELVDQVVTLGKLLD